jgi:hypothetical protein
MTPQDSLERRMAALFVLALALIVWQAPRVKPLVPPWYGSVLKPGEQVFPVAVPEWKAPEIPTDRQARFTFLDRHAVRWPGDLPQADCDLFVRVSLQHWTRRPVQPALLKALRADGMAGPVPWAAFRWTGQDFLDDDDGDGDPLDAGELHTGGPGSEAEVFCRP